MISLINITDVYQINDSTLDISWRNTAGPSLIFDNKKIQATGWFYLQTAQIDPNENGLAFMINTKVKLLEPKYNLWLGYDHLSGCNSANNNLQCFNNLYATNHKFYGTIDYYLNSPKDTRNAGLRDLCAGGQFTLGKKSTIQIDLHQLFLTEQVIVVEPEIENSNKNLGFEADFAFTFKIMYAVKLMVGQSIYLPTETTVFVKSITNEKNSFRTFTSLIITPRLY